MLIRRRVLIELLGLNRDSFDARVRRNLFPFTSEFEKRRAYTLHDALVGGMVERFHLEHGTPIEIGCSIALRAFPKIQARWDELARSRNLPVGSPERLIVSRTKRLAVIAPVLAINTDVGRADEYARRICCNGLVSTVAIDLTGICVELDARAERLGVDTTEYWLAGGA